MISEKAPGGSSILLDFIGNLGVFNVKTRDRRQILTRLAKDFLQKHAPPQN